MDEAGIDLSRPVVTSCGSGVTAAVVTLALESLGHTNNSLYDGSWSEWGSRADTPVATGDRVTLWGPGLPVEQLAQCVDTIAYELLCNITSRVRFHYINTDANQA